MKYNTRNFQFKASMITRIDEIIREDRGNVRPIVLIGDSIVQRIPDELLDDNTLNHGISGMTSQGLKMLLEEIVSNFNPKELYIHCGTNDLGNTTMLSPREIALNVGEIMSIIKMNIPDIKLNVVSTMPCDEAKESYMVLNRTMRSNDLIDIINNELQLQCNIHEATFIDYNQYCFDDNGNLILEYFEDDGLHLNSNGYFALAKNKK